MKSFFNGNVPTPSSNQSVFRLNYEEMIFFENYLIQLGYGHFRNEILSKPNNKTVVTHLLKLHEYLQYLYFQDLLKTGVMYQMDLNLLSEYARTFIPNHEQACVIINCVTASTSAETLRSLAIYDDFIVQQQLSIDQVLQLIRTKEIDLVLPAYVQNLNLKIMGLDNAALLKLVTTEGGRFAANCFQTYINVINDRCIDLKEFIQVAHQPYFLPNFRFLMSAIDTLPLPRPFIYRLIRHPEGVTIATLLIEKAACAVLPGVDKISKILLTKNDAYNRLAILFDQLQKTKSESEALSIIANTSNDLTLEDQLAATTATTATSNPIPMQTPQPILRPMFLWFSGQPVTEFTVTTHLGEDENGNIFSRQNYNC